MKKPTYDELLKALKPFAVAAPFLARPYDKDSEVMMSESDGTTGFKLRFGDFRRAKRLLKRAGVQP